MSVNPSSTSLTSSQWNADFYCLESFLYLMQLINLITWNFNRFNCTGNPLAVDVIFWELHRFWIVLRSTLVVQVYIVSIHLAASISERLARVHNRSGLSWFDSYEFRSEIKSWIVIKCGSCELEVHAFSVHSLQIGLISISHGNLALLKNF